MTSLWEKLFTSPKDRLNETGTFLENLTIGDDVFAQLEWEKWDPKREPKSPEFWLMVTSIVMLIGWIIFLTFYLSRIIGILISFLLNRYLKWAKIDASISFDSFSISVLAGKVMFRNFAYVTDDYTARCWDGWIIFSFWRCYNGRSTKRKKDRNKEEEAFIKRKNQASRLHISVNGLEVHVYNQMWRYERLAEIYGLQRLVDEESETNNGVRKGYGQIDLESQQKTKKSKENLDKLLALFGKVNLDVSSGRFVVGNHLLPTTLVISFDSANGCVTTDVPSQPSVDWFMLCVNGEADNFRASFVKTPEYEMDGRTRSVPFEEPPRRMGEGFCVLQTASLTFSYKQDILG